MGKPVQFNGDGSSRANCKSEYDVIKSDEALFDWYAIIQQAAAVGTESEEKNNLSKNRRVRMS